MVSTLPGIPTQASRELFRVQLPTAEVAAPFSAAGVQASRLAACDDGTFVFATGPAVYTLTCTPPKKRQRASELSPSLDYAISTAESEAIADDYIVPRPFSAAQAARLPIHSAHESEVQSVAADGARIASADALGRVIVTLDALSATDASSRIRSFVLPSASLSHGEPGWAGIALRDNDEAGAAVARQFFRDITLFDRDVPLRTLHCSLPPAALSFATFTSSTSGDVLTVAEGSDLAVYDMRIPDQATCVVRKTVSAAQLLSIDVSPSGSDLALAGMDRVLHIFDVRAAGVRDRWSSCLKYECAGALFSREVHGMAYVCSVDNEVACGAWSSELAAKVKQVAGTQSLMISGANTKSPRRVFGFRADVRLIGMARRDMGGEQIAVLSENGAFYLLRGRENADLDT